MRTTLVVGLLALSLGIALAVAQKIDMKPGKYEVTAEMMLPNSKMPPQTRSQCFTAEQLKDVSKVFLDPEFSKMCKVSDLKVNGNKVTFRSDCKQDDVQSTGTAEVTFAAESYSVVMTVKSSTGEAMTIKQNAKRIGECTK